MSGTDPDDLPGPPTRSSPPTTSGPPVESGPPGRQVWPDVPGATPSWQGAPGFSGVDPGSVPPHAPLPGAPPYPPGTEPERAAVADRSAQLPGVAAVLPRCVAAAAGWVAVALLLALFTGVGSWPLRGLALVVPWGLTALALVFPARRGVGPGGLVALAFAPFWLVHAFLVGLLGWWTQAGDQPATPVPGVTCDTGIGRRVPVVVTTRTPRPAPHPPQRPSCGRCRGSSLPRPSADDPLSRMAPGCCATQ